jgi:NAD(P)H-dependent FMN reductase
MKIIAINGSPRKKWNTATLLEKALEGAASQGAETELVHGFQGMYELFFLQIERREELREMRDE